MNVIVIDVGTSSMRGILYDAHAAELKRFKFPIPRFILIRFV